MSPRAKPRDLQLGEQVQRLAAGHPARTKVREHARQHHRVRGLHPGRYPPAHRGQIEPGRALVRRALAGADETRERRQQQVEQRQLVHQLEGARSGGDSQRAINLLDHARHRGVQQVLAMAFDSGARGGLDLEAKLGREAHRAQHPDRVLAHPHLGIADRADEPRFEVGDSAGVVDHVKGARVIKERVDREVAPKRVFLGRPESVVVTDQRIFGLGHVLGAAAEGGDLDIVLAEEDMDQAEAPSDKPRVAEQVAHLLGMRRRRDVEVLGPPPDHQVAHAAANQVGVVAGIDQPVEHLEHARVDIAAGDRMLGAFQDAGLGMSLQIAVAGINHQGRAQSSTHATTLSSGGPAVAKDYRQAGVVGRLSRTAIAPTGSMP